MGVWGAFACDRRVKSDDRKSSSPVTTSGHRAQSHGETAMLIRIAVAVVVGALLVVSSPVAAQQPTSPPTIDVTCHGYDEGPTRAYNCIPVAHQQHLLATFVPPVGSTCNGGQVAEFPPGRIVFQIRCQETGTGSTPPPQPTGWSASGRGSRLVSKPLNITRVRITSSFSGSSANFIVWCHAPRRDLIVNELIGTSWGNDGTVGVYRMEQCSEIDVTTDQTTTWQFSQEGGQTAFTPPRSWTAVTGSGSDLSAEALAALATATEVERGVR